MDEYRKAFSDVFVCALVRYSLNIDQITNYSTIILDEISKRLEIICNQSELLRP